MVDQRGIYKEHCHEFVVLIFRTQQIVRFTEFLNNKADIRIKRLNNMDMETPRPRDKPKAMKKELFPLPISEYVPTVIKPCLTPLVMQA